MALGGSALTWFDGRWHAGNHPVLGAADHGTWQGTLVFDGARSFDGVMPDLDLHSARVVRSAEVMGLAPPIGSGGDRGADPRGGPAVRLPAAALPPPDALVARGLAGDRRPGSRIDRAGDLHRGPAVSGARAAGADRLAVPAPAAGRGADRGEGRLPLSQQRPRRARGTDPRLPQRAFARPGRPRCRDVVEQRLPRPRRRGDDAGRRTAPSSPASPGGG